MFDLYNPRRIRTSFIYLVSFMIALVVMSIWVPNAHALTLPTSCNDAANEVLWCGAATPAQVALDYVNGDGHNSASSIQNIYNYYGITSSDINEMTTTAVAGVVTNTGEVLVNNQEVAYNAITAGRDNMAGSTTITYNGTTFYQRTPSVSFVSSSLDAFVVMNGNSFLYAVLSSCGNPIVATAITPVPTSTISSPNYNVQKLVAPYGSSNFVSELQTNPSSNVVYKILIDSTGNSAVNNLIVKDVLPNDSLYQTNTLILNGSQLTSDQVGSFFGSGLQLGVLPAGQSDMLIFTALVGANQNSANCTNESLPNTVFISASNLPNESATATVSIQCPVSMVPVSLSSAPPKQLVNTGPGNVAGIFAVTSLMGGIVYNFYLRRRASRR